MKRNEIIPLLLQACLQVEHPNAWPELFIQKPIEDFEKILPPSSEVFIL
jgi:hypothetical protein